MGVNGSLDGEEQASIISSEADATISINVPFMEIIFSGPAALCHMGQGAAIEIKQPSAILRRVT